MHFEPHELVEQKPRCRGQVPCFTKYKPGLWACGLGQAQYWAAPFGQAQAMDLARRGRRPGPLEAAALSRQMLGGGQ